MIKKMHKAAAATILVTAFSLVATAAHAATATGTARARILRQVTLTNTSDLQFGTIVTGAAASTVTIDAAGARTCGTGLACSGASTAAGFTIGGTTGQVVDISVPASVSLTSGANSMTSTLVASAATSTMVANAGSFTVGGVLSVGANQADGDYTGTFTATANYQ